MDMDTIYFNGHGITWIDTEPNGITYYLMDMDNGFQVPGTTDI